MPRKPEFSFLVMFPAECHIAFVGTEHDMGTFAHDFSVGITGVALCAFSTPADSRDFFYDIRNFHQSLGAWEQVIQKIGSKSVAENGNIIKVYKVRKQIYFLRE